jgi:hypothetical protein
VAVREGLLDFFLNARRTVVAEWLQTIPIAELRKIAEERFVARKSVAAPFLGDVAQAGKCVNFPEFVFDEEFRSALHKPVRELSALSDAKGCACFLPPDAGILNLEIGATAQAMEFLAAVPSKIPCIRTGFLSTEFDVWESIALGFNGLCVHARVLDLYEIQLLTEICRDYKTSLIAIADSRETLARVLESDCPYVGLWGYNPNTFAPDFSGLSKMAPKVPSTCQKIAFLPGADAAEMQLLAKMQVGVMLG